MNTKELGLLFVGVGIVVIAYWMKKQGFEGFQDAANPMGLPPMPPMGQPPMGQPPMPPMPPMPPTGIPLTGPPPMPPQAPPMPPMPPMPPIPTMPTMPAQPQPVGMKPNQQQLMDIATKVQKITGEQSAISAQLQQITQSFGSEGFQSYQNPYTIESPGDTQAKEFRLGKKSLVDNVLRY